MFKEDYELIQNILMGLEVREEDKEKLLAKVKLIVDRNNLDADYQKRIEDINNRFRPLIEEVKEESK